MPNRENDKCVCCGCDTGVPCNTPIAAREHYIYGCGQLCGNCYAELYIRNTEDDCTVHDGEMQRLIDMCKEKK